MCILLLLVGFGFAVHSSLFLLLNTSQYNFYDTDTWYSVREIERINKGEDISFDNHLMYPEGREITWGSFYPKLCAALFKGTEPLKIFNTAGFFAPILAALFAISIYFIIGDLLSESAGFYSASILAIGNGLFFQSSLFGVIDHHLLESILGTLVILLILLAYIRRSDWIIGTVVLLFVVLFYTSEMWIIYIALSGMTIWLCMAHWIYRKGSIKFSLFFITVSSISSIVVLSQVILNNSRLMSLLAWTEPIGEIQQSSLLIFILRFGLLVPIFIVGIYLFAQSKSNRFPAIAIILITLVFATFTARFERTECLFAPFFSIVCGYFIDEFTPKHKDKVLALVLIISLVSGAVIINELRILSNGNTEWNGAIEYLNTQEPSVVLSWWDYGHWVVSTTDQCPYSDPFQDRATETAQIFTSSTIPNLSSQNISYILVTNNDKNFYNAMKWYSHSETDYNESYLKRLMDGSVNNTRLYRDSLITIYRAGSVNLL